LILRDLQIYGKASIGQIHNRIGKEIPRRKLRRELADGIGRDREARNDESCGLPLDKITPNQPMTVKRVGLIEGLKCVRRLIFKALFLPNGGGNQRGFLCRSA